MPTAADYCLGLAAALDDLQPCGTSSTGTTSTVTLPLLVNAHASASANRYDGRYVYVVSGTGFGAQRTVRTGGFAPSTGVLTVDPTWTAPTSSVIALTGLFPIAALANDPKTSYLAICNRALGMIAMPERIAFAVTVGTDTYAATLYPWLDRQERIYTEHPSGDPYLESPIVSGRRPRQCGWRGIRLVLDGITPAFEIDVPFTGTLYVETLRPQVTLISGGDSVVGLVNPSDTALPTVEDVVRVGKMLACELLMFRSPGYPNGNWAEMYPTFVRDARRVRWFDRTLESPQAAAVPDEEAA